MRALWTPRQLVALRTKSLFVQSLSLVGKLCRIMWFILLPAAGWLAHWALAGEGWGVFETIAAALLLIPVAFALYLWLSPSGLPYSRTLRQSVGPGGRKCSGCCLGWRSVTCRRPRARCVGPRHWPASGGSRRH